MRRLAPLLLVLVASSSSARVARDLEPANNCVRHSDVVALLVIDVTPFPENGKARILKRYKGAVPSREISLERLHPIYESAEEVLARAPKAHQRYFACLDRMARVLKEAGLVSRRPRETPRRKLPDKRLYQLSRWYPIVDDSDLRPHELVTRSIRKLDSTRSASVQIGVIRALLRDTHPLVQQAGISEYREGVGGPRRPVIQEALHGDIVRLMASTSDAVVARSALVTLFSRVDAILSKSQAATSAEQRAQSAEHRDWADASVAMLTHQSSLVRFTAAVYLAQDRAKLESGKRYSIDGTPGRDEAMEGFCRARNDRRQECRLDWWLTVEKEALAPWRAWHAGGGHLKAVVPAR